MSGRGRTEGPKQRRHLGQGLEVQRTTGRRSCVQKGQRSRQELAVHMLSATVDATRRSQIKGWKRSCTRQKEPPRGGYNTSAESGESPRGGRLCIAGGADHRLGRLMHQIGDPLEMNWDVAALQNSKESGPEASKNLSTEEARKIGGQDDVRERLSIVSKTVRVGLHVRQVDGHHLLSSLSRQSGTAAKLRHEWERTRKEVWSVSCTRKPVNFQSEPRTALFSRTSKERFEQKWLEPKWLKLEPKWLPSPLLRVLSRWLTASILACRVTCAVSFGSSIIHVRFAGQSSSPR